MRLLRRQAWSRLACLAILAVIGLAACSSGPGVAAPTVKDDAGKVLAPTLPLVEEGTKSVSLSSVFTGASLEYSAASSDKAVATAAIANGKLTITARKAGPATITVTAKNAGGSVKYEVKVTVTAKPPGDAGEVAAPTKTAGARTSVVFEAGDTTETIALSSVFTGESLTFTVTSNNPTVANATITNSNRSLTITARRPGSATITVTATNAGGDDIAHSIRVTVREPEPELDPDPPKPPTTNNPSTCDSPLIIDLHGTEPCSLPSDKHYFEVETGEVTATQDKSDLTGKRWIILANKKGPFRITIFDGTGKSVGTLTGEVPNSRPNRKASAAGVLSELDDQTLTAAWFTSTAMNLTEIFEDPDEDELFYRIASKPDWVLIETKDGFVVTGSDDSTAATMNVDVMQKMDADDSFLVTLHAVDTGGAESRVPAAIKFNAAAAAAAREPREIDYLAEQQSTGKLHKASVLEVGPRRGVDHTLRFYHPDDSSTTFVFAESKNDSLEGKDLLPADTATTNAATDYYYKKPDGNYAPKKPPEYDSANKWSVGDSYFVLESSSAVEAKWPSSPSNEVEFKLKDKGSSGSIKIKYCVVPAKVANPAVAEGSDPATTASCTSQQSLTVNVITCTSFPASITVDCLEATN